MDDNYDDWDKTEEYYDSDDNIAVSPVVETDIIFDEYPDQCEIYQGRELKQKTSIPIMYDYEKSNLIAERQKTLDSGESSTMEEEIFHKHITSSYDIANLEFDNGKLPKYTIIRKFDRGYYEKWTHSDFLFFPK
jgi:hypothetical protein